MFRQVLQFFLRMVDGLAFHILPLPLVIGNDDFFHRKALIIIDAVTILIRRFNIRDLLRFEPPTKGLQIQHTVQTVSPHLLLPVRDAQQIPATAPLLEGIRKYLLPEILPYTVFFVVNADRHALLDGFQQGIQILVSPVRAAFGKNKTPHTRISIQSVEQVERF